VAKIFQTNTTFKQISRAVQALPQCGPWIAFKVADMGDRVMGYAVDFSDCELAMYRDPMKGAALVALGDKDAKISAQGVRMVVDDLRVQLGALRVPGLDTQRSYNLQEVETVLCKYKSHINGHYKPGKDRHEVAKMLEGYGDLAGHLRGFL
jgi:hypothetical protein